MATGIGVGIGFLSFRLHRLAESIPGLLKSLKIPSGGKHEFCSSFIGVERGGGDL